MTITTKVTTAPSKAVQHSINEYSKALLHIVVVILAAVVVYLKSGDITPTEYVNLGILLATSIGVYWTNLLPNAKFQSILKVGVAVAGAVLASLNTFLVPGATVNSGAIITIILAGAAALGVGVIPNGAPPAPPLVPAASTISYLVSTTPPTDYVAPPAPAAPVAPAVPPTV